MTPSDAFDCPNCGLLAVTADERCPDENVNATPDADGRTRLAFHSRKHLHTTYVRGCAACQYRDQLKAGIS